MKYIKLLILFLCFIPALLSDLPVSNNYLKQKELQKEMLCITQMLYHEARGEGEEGLRAVLSVVQNRKNHLKFPSSYCKVIHQSGQFSYIIPGKVSKEPYKASEKELKGLIQDLAFQAATGTFKNSFDSSDVLWYHHTKVKPKWSQKFKRVKTIKQHHFYELKEY